MALKFRLNARLDIRNDRLIKTINCEGVRPVGDPHEFAVRYANEGIDEILYLDAVASLYRRNSLADLVERTVDDVFVPVTVGGGIRSVEDARRLFLSGADKIAVNTAAVERPGLITELASKFGSQAVVLQLDAKRKGEGWEAYTHGGRNPTGKEAIPWAKEAVERGAGEILVTSIDMEGTRRGFDLQLTDQIGKAVDVPVIAAGGCGGWHHVDSAKQAGASAVAIAGLLHYRVTTVGALKSELAQAGVPIRPVEMEMV